MATLHLGLESDATPARQVDRCLLNTCLNTLGLLLCCLMLCGTAVPHVSTQSAQHEALEGPLFRAFTDLVAKQTNDILHWKSCACMTYAAT